MKILLFLLLTHPLLAKAWHFTPPADSNVVNVHDYGAKGDGKTDDTAAINRAISENIDRSRYRSNPFIFFPKGTYLVSGPLEGRVIEKGRDEGKVWSAGWRSMMIFIGETRDGSIIKLRDKAPGYGDPETPKWLIATGSEGDKRDNQEGGGNRAFRHNILNLTVDVGDDNPGAIAIDFLANNRGSVDGVTLRSGKNSGHVAINLTRWWPGPAFIHDVSIQGFDHAFKLRHFQYGMTFENIQITNPRKTAIVNNQNVLGMRKVTYQGSQPFYHSPSGHSFLTLLDSSLTTTAGQSEPAITTAGLVNLRRVKFTNFPTLIDDISKKNKDFSPQPTDTTIAHYHKGTTFQPDGQEPKPLDLPIEEIPTIRPPAGATWTPSGPTGETLQAAIDSGAEYIFLPAVTTVKFSKPVILRNKVKLIMGMHGCISGPGSKDKKESHDEPPAFIMGETGAPVVCLEHLFIGGRVENPSARTLVIRHADIEQYGLLANGPGKTHIVDVIDRNYHIGPDHSLWVRQLNAEFGADPLFTNSGTSWVLGFKMETSSTGSKHAPRSTPSIYNLDGQCEIFAGLLYTLGSQKKHAPLVPAFTNKKGTLAVSYRVNGIHHTHYPIILREGTLEKGKDTLRKAIKGPGATLLRSER